jgi:hypothetical protein
MDVCVTVSELWTTRPNGPAGGADGGAPSWFAEEPQPGSNEQAAKDAEYRRYGETLDLFSGRTDQRKY